MLTEFMGSNMSADAKSAVVATASKLMSTGIAGLTDVQAGVGVAQAAISAADTQNSAQIERAADQRHPASTASTPTRCRAA